MATTNNYEYSEGSLSTTLVLAKSYLYMGLGLLISGLTAFLVSFLFSWALGNPDVINNGLEGTVAITYLMVMIVSFLGLLIDGVVLRRSLVRSKRSAWPPYIIYSIFMGVFLSSFMLLGVDFKTMGMALCITALSFTIMFLIGARFKSAHPILAAMAGLGIGSVLIFLVFGFLALLAGSWTTYIMINAVVSLVILFVTVLVAGIDGARCREIVEQGFLQKNVALYCAFIMYGDFIAIFIRVLRVLLIFSRKK